MREVLNNYLQNPVTFIKSLSVLLLLTLPPWIALIKLILNILRRKCINSQNVKNKVIIIKIISIPIFIGYIALSCYSQNILPFLLVVIYFFIKYKTNYKSDEDYYIRPLRNEIGNIILYSFAFKVFITAVNAIFVLIIQQFGVEPQQQEVTKLFYQSSWKTILILSIMTTITAPVLEEFIFRHVFYNKLALRFGKVASTIFTSLLFMLVHFNLAGSIAFFGVGIYNCYLYEKYGYRAAVINHFVFNFISTFFMILYLILKNLGLVIK